MWYSFLTKGVSLKACEKEYMHVLSLDYHTNVPRSEKVSQGGPARFAKRLSTHLTGNKHMWTGIIARAEVEAIPQVKKVYTQPRLAYLEWKYDATTKNSLATKKNFGNPKVWLRDEINSLKKIIEEVNPDVIFLNGFSLVSWMLLQAGFECGVPIAMQHAGFFKKEILLYRDHFTENARRMLYQMERDITAMSSVEIFLNTWSEKVYNTTVQKVPKKKSSVIPLPYDEVSSSYKQSRTNQGEMRLGIVARWDRIKNHEAILALARKAKQRKLPWKFFAVTTIPDSKINATFKKDYQKFVTVSPSKSPGALRKFYKDMDILLLPSHFDVSPHVVMEAALEGVGTIISSNVGWGDEYRACGMGKWIVDFSSAQKTSAKIEKILTNKKSYSDDVGTLKKYLVQTHNPNTVFKQYETLFTNIATAK